MEKPTFIVCLENISITVGGFSWDSFQEIKLSLLCLFFFDSVLGIGFEIWL